MRTIISQFDNDGQIHVNDPSMTSSTELFQLGAMARSGVTDAEHRPRIDGIDATRARAATLRKTRALRDIGAGEAMMGAAGIAWGTCTGLDTDGRVFVTTA